MENKHIEALMKTKIALFLTFMAGASFCQESILTKASVAKSSPWKNVRNAATIYATGTIGFFVIGSSLSNYLKINDQFDVCDNKRKNFALNIVTRRKPLSCSIIQECGARLVHGSLILSSVFSAPFRALYSSKVLFCEARNILKYKKKLKTGHDLPKHSRKKIQEEFLPKAIQRAQHTAITGHRYAKIGFILPYLYAKYKPIAE